MYCTNCGYEVREGGKFCYNCGAKIQEPQADSGGAQTQEQSADNYESQNQKLPVNNGGAQTQEQPADNYGSQMQEQPADNYGSQMQEQPTDNYGSQIQEQPYDNSGTPIKEQPVEKDNYQQPIEASGDDYVTVKTRSGKIKPIIIIGILAVIILGFVLFIFISGSLKSQNWYFHPNSENPVEVINNKIYYKNGRIRDTSNDSFEEYAMSLDHSTAAFINSFEVLCYVNAQGIKTVEGNVIDFKLTDNGNGIVYQAVKDDTWVLKYYEIGADKPREIDQADAFDGYIGGFSYRVSPNGDTIFYRKLRSNGGSTYLYQNGKVKYMGDDIFPHAVSNNGEYLYYYSKESYDLYEYYVAKGNDEFMLCNGLEYSIVTRFNADYSECLFYNDRTYLYADGDVHKLFDDYFIEVCRPLYSGYANENTLGIDSFKNKVILTFEDNLFFINGKYDYEKLDSDIDFAVVSRDGNSLLYMDFNQEVYYVKDLRKDTDSDRILKDLDVYTVEVNPDLTELYILTEDEKLYYKKKSGKEELLDRNVVDIAISSDKKTLYYLTDYRKGAGTLYYCENGGKCTEVKDGDNITGIFRGETTVSVIQKYDNRDYTNQFIISDEHELIPAY
jgi:hypothetical protein